MALDVLVAPALDAVDDEEPPPRREGHGAQRGRDEFGRRVVALEDLGSARPALPLSERAQPRAPLGDPPVIVAVDEVGRLEGRHGGESKDGAGPTCGS